MRKYWSCEGVYCKRPIQRRAWCIYVIMIIFSYYTRSNIRAAHTEPCASNARAHASLSLTHSHILVARTLTHTTHLAVNIIVILTRRYSHVTNRKQQNIPIWKSILEYKIRTFTIYNNLICNWNKKWIPTAYKVSSTRDSYYAVQTTYEKILLKWKYLHVLIRLQLIWIKNGWQIIK